MLNTLKTERGDLLLFVTQLQHKTTLKYVNEADTLNVDDEVLRKRMEKSIAAQ